MRREAAELKRLARETLTGRYGIPMGALVVTELIGFVLSGPFARSVELDSPIRDWGIYFLATLVISLLTVVLDAGRYYISLKMARKQQYAFKDLFCLFSQYPDRYILVYLLIILIQLIPAVPALIVFLLIELTIPGVGMWVLFALTIIIMLIGQVYLLIRYALVFYLLLDHAELGVTDALKESARLMQGHMGRYLYILMSFIGWGILGFLSFGIGFLWISPYMDQTMTTFYLDVTGELDQQEGFYAEV